MRIWCHLVDCGISKEDGAGSETNSVESQVKAPRRPSPTCQRFAKATKKNPRHFSSKFPFAAF